MCEVKLMDVTWHVMHCTWHMPPCSLLSRRVQPPGTLSLPWSSLQLGVSFPWPSAPLPGQQWTELHWQLAGYEGNTYQSSSPVVKQCKLSLWKSFSLCGATYADKFQVWGRYIQRILFPVQCRHAHGCYKINASVSLALLLALTSMSAQHSPSSRRRSACWLAFQS